MVRTSVYFVIVLGAVGFSRRVFARMMIFRLLSPTIIVMCMLYLIHREDFGVLTTGIQLVDVFTSSILSTIVIVVVFGCVMLDKEEKAILVRALARCVHYK